MNVWFKVKDRDGGGWSSGPRKSRPKRSVEVLLKVKDRDGGVYAKR